MISTGSTGTLRQVITPNIASMKRVKTLLWMARRARGSPRAPASYAGRQQIADHLQREIGLPLALMSKSPSCTSGQPPWAPCRRR
jgi:hypothetical protein